MRRRGLPRRGLDHVLSGWGNRDARGVRPHSVKVVIRPSVFLEDVQHDISVVHQDPGSITLARERSLRVRRFQVIDDGVRDRVGHPLAVSGHNDQVVGVCRLAAYVDDGEILPFPVLRRDGDRKGFILGFDSRDLLQVLLNTRAYGRSTTGIMARIAPPSSRHHDSSGDHAAATASATRLCTDISSMFGNRSVPATVARVAAAAVFIS